MRAARTDNNHTQIVEAIRDAGALIFSTAGVGMGFPDICVAYAGRNWLLEIKGPKGELTPLQKAIHRQWSGYGQMAVVRTPEEALRAIGAIK